MARHRVFALLFSAILLVTRSSSYSAAILAPSCESLATFTLPNATITLAASVAAGQFRLDPASPDPTPAFRNAPAFCRVAATLKPSSDSDIKVEVWMPMSDWNGKFQAVGNGGWGGSINYAAMRDAILRGYATSSTDTGHTGGRGIFALGHPEKLIDYAYRSEHEMTVLAKKAIVAFYGKRPDFSYWNGCSAGGKQGLVQAQRFPKDYDGIIAGAPANPLTPGFAAWAISVGQSVRKDSLSPIPATKLPMIHEAVVNTCDAIDGLKDGLIEDPRRCHFDPKLLACHGGDEPSCLTEPQVESARRMTSPAVNPRTGAEVFPGLSKGSELGWNNIMTAPVPFLNGVEYFQYVVFKDAAWDWKSFNIDTDVALAEKLDKGKINDVDTLRAFSNNGGKLLMYQGWNDPTVAPLATINYYTRVLGKSGASSGSKWVRLFMAPGMGHCRGGDGPNSFDALGSLDEWVRNGKAPDQIPASHSTQGIVDRTRPLCPYPTVARYKSNGSIDDAANFVCK